MDHGNDGPYQINKKDSATKVKAETLKQERL